MGNHRMFWTWCPELSAEQQAVAFCLSAPVHGTWQLLGSSCWNSRCPASLAPCCPHISWKLYQVALDHFQRAGWPTRATHWCLVPLPFPQP